jgi:hypothetical protein
MSKGYGLKDPVPPLVVREHAVLSCYRDLMHKYGSLTPIIIKDRYSHLLRKADSKGPKKGRPRIFDIIAPEESQCHQ